MIYFKSAGVFRTYNSNEFDEKFLNRIRTNYRGQNEIYEVVGDDGPQKIIIVVDSRDKNELSKIKQYIIDYSQASDQKIKTNDLVVFDNIHTSTFEIIIKNIIASNVDEKDVFIRGLLKFIEKTERNGIITNKMAKRVVSDLDGASIVMIPQLKQALSSYANIIDGYITKNVPVNVNIHIGDNIHVEGDMNTNNYVSDDDDKFIQYLENANLDWFEPGNEILYETLYNEYSNIGTISKRRFTAKYKNVLFSKMRRTTKNGKKLRLVTLI